MKKRFSQNEKGFYTNAQAAAFISCAVQENFLGEDEWCYIAILFAGNEVRVLKQREVCLTEQPEKLAMYDTAFMVLEYCERNNITSVDILYDSDEMLVEELFSLNRPIMDAEDRKISELYTRFGADGIQFYRETMNEVECNRLLRALRRNVDRSWVNRIETEQVFLTLAKGLAEAEAEENEDLIYDINNCIYIATEKKEVVTDRNYSFEETDIKDFREIEEFEEDIEDMDEPYFGEEAEDEPQVDTEESDGHRRTVWELILETAESIKKERMTTLHLLYAYACFVTMTEKEICENLGLGKAARSRISYVKNRMKVLFDLDEVKIDPEKLKLIIPQYIEEFELDRVSEADYELVVKTTEEWKKEKAFPEDIIAYAILNKLLFDTKTYHPFSPNQEYLRHSKPFALDRGALDELREKAGSLEEIAGKSKELFSVLSQKIFGQDSAIEKFVQGYVNSKLAGAGRKEKPAACYLFAGPPGVGKTYLAKLASEVLHMPMRIFDMSEYVDEHSANGLVGFEKTWKASAPGVLTSYVNENPASILVIDEIEKAHKSVQMQFLQILEGARLYDKYYEKHINFEHTILIFTTNCGKSLYEQNEEADLSELSEPEILDALREDEAFPSELCSRFAAGNMIMFNHLQPYYLCDIVRNKMDEVVEEVSDSFSLKITYDKLLPELFLFQAGSSVDARVASSQSAELIKDNIVSFAKEEVEKSGTFAVENLSVGIKLDKEKKEVYNLFVNEEVNHILAVSDSPKLETGHPQIKVWHASDENEMIQIIRENTIDAVLIDLTYKMEKSNVQAFNALGVISTGRTCLDVIKEKAPQIPLYIVNQETYHAEDRKAVINFGARGMFTEGADKAECVDNLQKLLEQLYIQKQLRQLSQKGQRMDYRIRYCSNGKEGVIEFYDLVLKKAEMNDTELRRKAKKSKVFDFERPNLRFSDIIGAKQAKREFRHFINYIHNIDRYVLEGADTPKGILLYGPPGTGKTSLAKALAGECDALFLNTTGASIRNAENPIQEIKDLFKIAYINAPAILFIDEIDVIAKERMGYDSGTEILVNTLLTEMEGFQEKDPFKPVFVVAATNYNVSHSTKRPGEVVIDPALVRRFDNPVYVGLPDREERKQYMQMLLKKKNYADKISEIAVDYVAEHTGGKSFAFVKQVITNMTNTVLDAKKEISDDLLTETLETQLYGEKRENDEVYRLSVARHEMGHAYVAWKTGREPKFITIVSRGDFGGYVSYGDGEDVNNLTKEDFLNYICQALAGRAAEMVYYGDNGINTGASSDLEHATQYAIRMICHFGMGNLGLISVNPERILDSPKGTEVLEEANKILEAQMKRAMNFIREGKAVIDHVVEVLMDKSYIQGENLIAVLEAGGQTEESVPAKKKKSQKWYAVIKGRKPGIYTTWEACRAQVSGYSNAVYRSFYSEEEARLALQNAGIVSENI